MSKLAWRIRYADILHGRYQFRWLYAFQIAGEQYPIAKSWGHTPWQQFNEDFRET